MSYAVKEIYTTVQGEGFHTGRPAVFLRFAGCNLWSGVESDRQTAICQFCDTDFFGTDGPGGGKFTTASDLSDAVYDSWRTTHNSGNEFVVVTGGEPLLQLDEALISALHTSGFEIAVETNGTIGVPASVDWVCVSPKANAELVQRSGHELKLVYPQSGAEPQQFEQLAFEHFFLQPMDGPLLDTNVSRTIQYCRQHPRWRVSIQSHKYLGIP